MQEAGVRSPYREVRVSTAVDHFKHVGLVCFGNLDVRRELPEKQVRVRGRVPDSLYYPCG